MSEGVKSVVKQRILGALVGVLAALIYLPLLGFLSFHERARQEGLVVSWNLVDVTTAEPRRTLLPVLGMILLGALFAWALLRGSTRFRAITPGWPLFSAGATLLVIVLLTTIVSDVPVPDTLSLSESGFAAYVVAGATGATTAALGAVLCVASLFLERKAVSTPAP
ncbi:hypothetical protein [Mycetocola saprophilus]|uniref:hypothetical protein n=1 Tax=Mycetocola saprophilus TaxID=76636 RepID=UPI0012DF013C|nr:hypothetical protein [Mycetocola saprophilus]